MTTTKPYRAKSLKGAQTYVRTLLRQRQELQEMLKEYARDRRMLAMLAVKKPKFYNPWDVWAAEKLRDEILRAK